MKYDWTIGLLALLVYHVFRILCLLFAAWYICHQFNLELVYWVRSFKPWKSQTGSSPQWNKLSALNIRSFNYNYISATASKSQLSWSLGSLSPTQHRVRNSVQYEQATIGGSYSSIFLPQCFCQKKRIHWKRTVQLGILACSALLLWVWLLRAAALHWDSYPSWSDQSHGGKTASCFQMRFMQLSVLSKAVLLGHVETYLTTQIPTAAAWWRLHKLPPSVCERNDLSVVCVCASSPSNACDTAFDHLRCWLNCILVVYKYLWLCQWQVPLQGLCNTPKKVEATVVWKVWNTG